MFFKKHLLTIFIIALFFNISCGGNSANTITDTSNNNTSLTSDTNTSSNTTTDTASTNTSSTTSTDSTSTTTNTTVDTSSDTVVTADTTTVPIVVETTPVITVTTSGSTFQTVLQIIMTNCQNCHSSPTSNGAPMSLTTFSQISFFASSISTRVNLPQTSSSFMPRNNSPLSATDLSAIDSWIANGKLNN